MASIVQRKRQNGYDAGKPPKEGIFEAQLERERGEVKVFCNAGEGASRRKILQGSLIAKRPSYGPSRAVAALYALL